MKKLSFFMWRKSLLLLFYLMMVPLLKGTLFANTFHRPLQTVVTGNVTDADGLPLSGVTIQVESKDMGTISDIDGSFAIHVFPTDVLVFSMVGFKTLSVSVANRDKLMVQMEEDVTVLGEVVLNAGYYTVLEKERTGNIEKVAAVDIEKQPMSNPLAALQGRVAGVEVVQSSGVPGAGFEIKIRGRNSIRTSGNEPLYVVDGVPYASSTLGESQASGIILPGSGISPLNNINPNDIESIEILKDADATAIYGSRGANGVVLITTKKGTVGTDGLEIDINTSMGKVANTVDLLGTREYLEMRLEAYDNDGIDPLPFNAYDINGTWDTDRETDWQDALFGRTAYITNVRSSFSGGNALTRYLLSGNFNRQTTVFPGDFANDKVSVLGNMSHRTPDDRFKIRFSANYTFDDNLLPGNNPVLESFLLAPNAPEPFNEDGSLNWEGSTWNNPFRLFAEKYEAKSSSLISSAYVGYSLMEGLELSASLGYTETNLDELRTIPATVYDPAFGLGPESSVAFHNSGKRNSWVIEPQLNWAFEKGPFEIRTLVGMTFQEQKSERLSQLAFGFSSNGLIESISAASNLLVIGDDQTQYRYNAAYGRVNLNLGETYILNLTGRRDGSSRFGTDRRFANFGAVGAAWIFSNETFVAKALTFISFGKLRGSYGTSGNDQIGDYQYLDTYSFGFAQYQNVVGLRPTRLFNPIFSWEENQKLEFGLEMGLFKDRIFLSANRYRNRSSNQLVGIPLPGTTGFSNINGNLAATVENSGWELQLNTQNIVTEKFRWSTSLNLSLPKNQLIAFPDLEGSTYANQLVIGEPLNIQKVFRSTGVDTQTGLHGFVDVNGDGAITSPDDRQTIIDLNPEYFGGLENSFSFGKLDLDVLFQFTKQKGFSFLSSRAVPGAMSNQPGQVLERWRTSGDRTTVQRFSSGLEPMALTAFLNYSQSDAAIVDASFLRLKNISLSYPLLEQSSAPFGCLLYLRAQNLWTWTDYDGLDPETRSSNAIPPIKYVTVGAKLTF
ncbi:SusC/RagA family TonB-linked outer membrane protein [Flagellimonas marina]|uniref:SusC/RagA family TonB-linked outer membrane protein n=1 Tax=Flagellimonas marina TaxID=1775168 RepID=A0ABV8PG57_9FLAO